MRWRAVLFDRDGTLFDSLPVILRSFNYAVEPFVQKPVLDAEWIAAFGPAEPEVLAKFAGEQHKREAFHRFYHYYQEHFSEISLFPGAREMLQRLAETKAKIGLFTGAGETSTQFCLSKEKILYLFDVLVTGDQVEHPKPHPEGVWKAMNSIGAKPSETVLVGDSDADMEAGRAAGVTTILARWGTPAFPGNSEPDFAFDSISDLHDFLFSEL
jgi:pyrophosphatase PpaX